VIMGNNHARRLRPAGVSVARHGRVYEDVIVFYSIA